MSQRQPTLTVVASREYATCKLPLGRGGGTPDSVRLCSSYRIRAALLQNLALPTDALCFLFSSASLFAMFLIGAVEGISRHAAAECGYSPVQLIDACWF
jgi:hypothetical protein